MDCKEFREVLDLYVDGELSPEAWSAGQLHVSECEHCRKTERQLLKLRSGLKQIVRQHEPPANLVTNVQRITQSRWRKVFRDFRQGPNIPGVKASRTLWTAEIRLPVPVFALLLIALITFAILPGRIRLPKAPSGGDVRVKQNSSDGRAEQEQLTDLSRFDQGRRASLYKAERQ